MATKLELHIFIDYVVNDFTSSVRVHVPAREYVRIEMRISIGYHIFYPEFMKRLESGQYYPKPMFINLSDNAPTQRLKNLDAPSQRLKHRVAPPQPPQRHKHLDALPHPLKHLDSPPQRLKHLGAPS